MAYSEKELLKRIVIGEHFTVSCGLRDHPEDPQLEQVALIVSASEASNPIVFGTRAKRDKWLLGYMADAYFRWRKGGHYASQVGWNETKTLLDKTVDAFNVRDLKILTEDFFKLSTENTNIASDDDKINEYLNKTVGYLRNNGLKLTTLDKFWKKITPEPSMLAKLWSALFY